jgi:hypothetical protein
MPLGCGGTGEEEEESRSVRGQTFSPGQPNMSTPHVDRQPARGPTLVDVESDENSGDRF